MSMKSAYLNFWERYFAMNELRKYCHLRMACQWNAIGHDNLVWMMDVDLALDGLEPLTRQVLIGRALGYSSYDLAREMHMSESAIWRHSVKAERELYGIFVRGGVMDELPEA
jgi:hypothetical protein